MSSLKTIFLFFWFVAPTYGFAQTLTRVHETDSYVDYAFRNDSLRLRTPISLMADRGANGVRFELKNPVFKNAPKPKSAMAFLSKTDPERITNVSNPGFYRKKPVSTLELRVVVSRQGVISVLQSAHLRVFKTEAVNPSMLPKTGSTSPFASGDWYKIPISKSGIYQLNRAYLQNLGINPDGINPKNIQVWAGPGFELPKENSAPRPDFVEIPILVEGESDNRFDASDRILFFQNDPNRVRWTTNTSLGVSRFEHQLHKSSTQNFVFLTVGATPGKRLTPVQPTESSPTVDITRFTDFRWKEDERTKAEPSLKSGSQWLGAALSVQTSGSTPIFADTLVGFESGSISVEAAVAGRSTGASSRFVFRVNGTARDSINVASIFNLNAVTGDAAIAAVRNFTTQTTSTNGVIQLAAQFKHSNSFSSTGFIDYIRLWAERPLQAVRGQLAIYETVGSGSSARYVLQGFSSAPTVLDVTNPLIPVLHASSAYSGGFAFIANRSAGRIYYAQSAFPVPAPGTKIANQNIRGAAGFPQLVIVTSNALRAKALEFAAYRSQKSGIETVVVTQDQLFNEFSAGVPDFVAIRDYMRYLYTRTAIESQMPKYLLLFGDATYDYKRIETDALTNHVFTYETLESLDRIDSYGSDDFFGLLDETEGTWDTQPSSSSNRVDIGIGRFPVQNEADADVMIRKIQSFENPAHQGYWRSLFTFVSDDDVSGSSNDRDLHLINADFVAESIQKDRSGLRIRKIHTMNYQAQTTALGRRFPDATSDVINTINDGTLIVNYSGHGDERSLSDEKLFDTDYLSRMNNTDKYGVLITATCSFGRFDDSEGQSGAEKMVLLPNAGMVASFTTTRTVFTSDNPNADNFGLNMDLTEHLTYRNAAGNPLLMGEIYMLTKNQSPGATINGRKFILLGDPSMRFGLPEQKAALDSLNGAPVAGNSFSFRALDNIHISGFVGNTAADPGYNGTVTVSVFDGIRRVKYAEKSWTASCNPEYCFFNVQNDVLFKGQATVRNGRFSLTFIVPKDIQFSSSPGRIHVYASGTSFDAAGGYSGVLFNGINPGAVNDGKGPDLTVFLNDTTFVSGGLVNPGADLIVRLSDQSGINTAGTGVGHELTAVINTTPETVLALNGSYTSEKDDYRKGSAIIPLPALPDGNWSVTVRAWDVFNNMSESQLHFNVAAATTARITNVYNYPNPMSGFTRFVFEHNLAAGTPVTVSIRIFTLNGKPVYHTLQTLTTSGNLQQFLWNGLDRDGDKLANGTYLYHIGIEAETSEGPLKTEKIEKLVIIR